MRLRALSLLCCLPVAALANEGMWTPDQLPRIAADLRAAGLALDPAQLSDLTGHPMGAIVSLGGCSASFVSPEGLAVTNHHCVQGAIQLNSSTERNLLRDGFSADRREDELSAGPNARVYVTESIRDVTAQVIGGLPKRLDARARYARIEQARKRLVAACESEPGRRCTVAAFHGGAEYRLLRQMEIRDVRLVYAPPGAIGEYGGDVDNWMWPRHTGDFAFLRAYVAPDGTPAAFDVANVPYRPKHVLELAPQGVQDGDFVMVAGYPGTTFRHRSADDLAHVIEWQYPKQIERNRDLIDLVAALGREDEAIRIAYASFDQGWNNAAKNWEQQLEGFRRADALATKRADEAALLAWLEGQGADGADGLAALHALRDLQAKGRAQSERSLLVDFGLNFGLMGAARTIVRAADEATRPDAQREPGYQNRDRPQREGELRQLERRLVPAVDRAITRYWLGRYVALPADQRVPELDTWLGEAAAAGDLAALDAALDALYAGTRLTGTAERLRWFESDLKAIRASDDRLLQFAVALHPALLRMERERKAQEADVLALMPRILRSRQAFNDQRGRVLYPDANSTLRLTYGSVTGSEPRDGLAYRPFTTLEGLLAKHTGVEPFDVPAAQRSAIAERRHGDRADAALGSVPVNFLANLDVTGGNSGSATLNAQGQLVGLVFDMTSESVASNWVFDPAVTRTIHVDLRYMLWVMEQVAPAPALLRELGLAPAAE